MWTVPTPITSGGDYQVKITSINNTTVTHLSDINFTIENLPTEPEELPKISVGNTKITEGNKNKTAKFQVTLDNPSDEIVKVNYTTANQTAKVNQDYRRKKGTLTFQPGETTKTIDVTILGDTKTEPNEKFKLQLSQPQNAELDDKVGIATIINDDKRQPNISVSDAKIVEGNGGRKNLKFQVTLDTKPEETVRVNYATGNQTAKANQDYKTTKGTLTFKPGQTRKTITIPVLGDGKIEGDETFQLNLSKPRNAKIKDRRGIGTIRDNDFPTVSIKDAEITEGDDGEKQLKFDVTLNTKVNKRVEVSYATADGTAKKGSDYEQTQGKLVFRPNQKKKTVTVPILGDFSQEDNENFIVNLRKPKNAKLGDKRAIGKIKDNDDGKNDGSLQTAINLGMLTEEVVVDEIGFSERGDRDTNDYYRFRVNKESNFVLFLDDMLLNANVDLYGSSEELINQSKNKDAQREKIVTVLEPGTYYVMVYPQGGDRTPYRLSLNLI
ncbi:MAG: hypothetical protein F6K39_08775 [Okeania sp. SIO3B3]|nr:hypothetical protein [Okeania sp. SIO3B3]